MSERATPETSPVHIWIDDVVRDVAELPGRDSPEDQPEIMLVTATELRDCIERNAPDTNRLERERDAALKALATRTKQMGVACMEHDLTHSLACGHCYAEALEALRAFVGDLDLPAESHAKLRGEDEVRVPVSDGILQRARAILTKANP